MRRTETFSITGDRTTVTVDTASGSVEVRAATSGTLTVNLDTEHPEDWDISQLGDLVSVRSPRRRGLRNRAAKMYLEVPPGTHVEIAAASADVSLAGPLGDVRVRTASGDVRAGTVQSMDAATASGSVKVDTVLGRLTASTASGNIKVGAVGEDVDAGTASGDVRIGCCQGGTVHVKAVSGNVAVGLPAGIRVEPDIATLSGKTTLPSPSRTAPPDGPRRTVRVRLRSVSGDITVDRVDAAWGF
ncbi:MAG: hypothetical protein RJA49_2656 [Actinomycetota bacterium]|jgi:DUF4097 and DUF4098 domain-containing protein YvlB